MKDASTGQKIRNSKKEKYSYCAPNKYVQLAFVGQEWERGDRGHCGGGQLGKEAAAHGS